MAINPQHPSIIISDEVRKELLERLNKAELIVEIEFLKRQREELLRELQVKTQTIRGLQKND